MSGCECKPDRAAIKNDVAPGVSGTRIPDELIVTVTVIAVLVGMAIPSREHRQASGKKIFESLCAK
jgi:hypothetical protein